MKALLLPFLLFSTLCIAQEGTLNQIDTNGKKQGHWIYYGKDRPELGYPANGKIEEGYYKDNRKERLWTKYHNDGITPKLTGEYKNNRPHGNYQKFYRNGQLKEEGCFHRGNFTCIRKMYLENGKTKSITNMKVDSIEYDVFYFYFENACLDSVQTYDRTQGIVRTVRYSQDSCDLILGESIDTLEMERSHSLDGSFIRGIYPTNTMEKFVPDSTEIDSAEVDVIFEMFIPKSRKNGNEVLINELKIIENDTAFVRNYRAFIRESSEIPNAKLRLYNEFQEIFIQGDFINGQLFKGRVYVYDEDGILLRVAVFRDGRFDHYGQL